MESSQRTGFVSCLPQCKGQHPAAPYRPCLPLQQSHDLLWIRARTNGLCRSIHPHLRQQPPAKSTHKPRAKLLSAWGASCSGASLPKLQKACPDRPLKPLRNCILKARSTASFWYQLSALASTVLWQIRLAPGRSGQRFSQRFPVPHIFNRKLDFGLASPASRHSAGGQWACREHSPSKKQQCACFLCPRPTLPPHFPPSLPCEVRQDRLAYIIRGADAKACQFWGCVLHFVAKLIPLPTYGRLYTRPLTSENCNTSLQ